MSLWCNVKVCGLVHAESDRTSSMVMDKVGIFWLVLVYKALSTN
jgi:hypothetical protein